MCGDDDEKDLLPTALLRSVGAVGKSEDAFFRKDVLIVEAPSLFIPASSSEAV